MILPYQPFAIPKSQTLDSRISRHFIMLPLRGRILDQLVDVIAALAVALGALDAEHVELAFDVAEDEMGPRHLRDR
jgi:hypothetical protein